MKTAPLTVLIVEDEPELRDLLVEEFSGAGFKVLSAQDGEEGLSLFVDYAKDIDVVVSDLKMPKMSGLEFLSVVRKASKLTPFVFLTGFADQEVAVQALKLGAFDLLEKPFRRLEVLVEIVTEAGDFGKMLKQIPEKITEYRRKYPESSWSDVNQMLSKTLPIKYYNQCQERIRKRAEKN